MNIAVVSYNWPVSTDFSFIGFSKILRERNYCGVEDLTHINCQLSYLEHPFMFMWLLFERSQNRKKPTALNRK